MKVEIATKEEYNELMALMNLAFDMKDNGTFQHILPKIYDKENDSMVHFILKDQGRIVASIGLYPMKLHSPYYTLKGACVGAVSTHPDYRKNRCMSTIMPFLIEYAKKEGYDILFLGGDRIRYSHFGFEYGGRRLNFSITKRCAYRLNTPLKYRVENLIEKDKESLKVVEALYNQEPQRIERDSQKFYQYLITWNSIPYLVKVEGKIVGYYCKNEQNEVNEIHYLKEYEDYLFKAALGDSESVSFKTSVEFYSSALLNKVGYYEISNCKMFKILNLKHVAQYMNSTNNYQEAIIGLDESAIIRKMLGDTVFPSPFSTFSMYISILDEA